MNSLQLFLPCAAGVEDYLATEARTITGLGDAQVRPLRAGVLVDGSWREAMLLNLHSRLAQRVLVQLSRTPYANESDLYQAASELAWETWFTPRHTFRIDITAQRSPLRSLNFAALRIKDAVADRFRERAGSRPSVDTHWPDVRIFAHLTNDRMALYIDTSGEPLFKRGWREDKGDAPLKETLAAAMIAATGWDPHAEEPLPLYDPCCGSATVVIEAAQMACRIAPGSQRRFAFEKLLPYQEHVWFAIKEEAASAVCKPVAAIFGSDISHRMVDFGQRNAERAGVAHALQLRGGDALQRMPPVAQPGIILLNPPYGERFAAAGSFGRNARERMGQVHMRGREQAQTEDGGDFFQQLATHWKRHYSGWQAWMLTPDLKLPGKMRLKESRRVPMWNGPIECRLFKFDMVAGKLKAAGVPPAAKP